MNRREDEGQGQGKNTAARDRERVKGGGGVWLRRRRSTSAGRWDSQIGIKRPWGVGVWGGHSPGKRGVANLVSVWSLGAVGGGWWSGWP